MNDALAATRLPAAFRSAVKRCAVRLGGHVLWVRIDRQQMFHFKSAKFTAKSDSAPEYVPQKSFVISTSRFGIGQIADSNCTPLGLHRIAEKIGRGSPAGTVFKARKVVGHTSQPEFADAKITTRILWLEGLEDGLNRGGKVDSHERYIYIHGTGDEATLGRPASCGCIHLGADDLIPLFNKVPKGTLVWIER